MYVQVITGFLSLATTRAMGQVARKSSQDWDGKARLTRARVSLMEIGIWWSRGGYIVWMRMHASGLTFEEWDPAQAVDKSQEPAPMIINSSQLRAAGFKPIKLCLHSFGAAARSGMI